MPDVISASYICPLCANKRRDELDGANLGRLAGFTPDSRSARSRVTARALAVFVLTPQPVRQTVALDAAGAIAFHARPLSINSLAEAERCQPDVIVMDARSSFAGFVQLYRSARTLERIDHIPIIAWLDRGDADQIAESINAGVEDCLTADVDCADSLARLRAASRRATSRTHQSQIRFGDILLDTACLKVWRKGRIIPLTVFQLRLLEFLMNHPGKVFSRKQLLEEVWGKDSTDEGAVTACISRIRRALSSDGGDGMIRSVRGAGYALDHGLAEMQSHDIAARRTAFFKL